MTKELPLIERITEVTTETAIGIGKLMPDLSVKLHNKPVDLDLLRNIVESPDKDLFIARVNGKIVGSAVMNLIIFSSGKKAWLEDFVVSSDDQIRGSGIGYALWQEIVSWSREREAPLEFTSSPLRELAHKFYRRQGAIIKPTAVFHLDCQAHSNSSS